MRIYVAKKAHKRGCSLCGRPIIPGDSVHSWPWLGDTPPASSNIMHVHATCRVIQEREKMGEWTIGEGFECYNTQPPRYCEAADCLWHEAGRALDEARTERKVSDAKP